MEQLTLNFEEYKITDRIVYSSRFFSCLEKRLMEDIASLKKQSPLTPLVVIVPSAILGTYLRSKVHGAGIRFHNFKQFAQALSRDYMEKNRIREVPSLGEELLAISAISEVAAEESLPEDYIESPGFLAVMMSLIKDFRQGGFDGFNRFSRPIDVEELMDVLHKKGSHVINRNKLVRVFKILNRYRQKFNDRLYDVEDFLKLAASSAGNFSAVFKAEKLLIYGTYNLDRLQKKLISEVSKFIDTIAYIPVLPGNPFSDEKLAFFKDIGFKSREIAADSSLKNAAAFVKYRLFTEDTASDQAPDKNIAGDGSVKILSCPDPAGEVREIAREIINLAERGELLKDMSVVIKDSGDIWTFDNENLQRF